MKKSYILLAAIALFVVFNFSVIDNTYQSIAKSLTPIFIGVLFSLILDIPVSWLKKKMKLKKPKLATNLAIFVTLSSIVLVFGIIIYFTSHELIKSIDAFRANLPSFMDKAAAFIESNGVLANKEKLLEVLNKIFVTIGENLPKVLGFLMAAFGTIFDIGVGLFLGILIAQNKDELTLQFQKVLKRFVKDSRYTQIISVKNIALQKFSGFLSGQALEALIFGSAVYVVLLLFRVPYAPLIAFIMALANLIPMLGGYIGGILSFGIILTVSSEKAFLFVVIIIILQQIEQLTTYPIIVGKNVKISSFWVLASVVVGGSLFGFWGILLGVPFTATILELMEINHANKSLILRDSKRFSTKKL